MSETLTSSRDVWRELLLADEHEVWLERALRSLSPNFLVQAFLNHFPPYHRDILVLTGKPMKQVTADDIVGRLGKIRERKPDIVEHLVRVWVDVHTDTGPEDAGPLALVVIAWLQAQTEDAPPPSWTLLRQITESRAEALDKATEIESNLEDLRRELGHNTKNQMDARLEVERARSRQFEELANKRTQVLKVKEGEIASLKRNLEAYRLQVIALQKTQDDMQAAHQRVLRSNQQRITQHYEQALAEKRRHAELEKHNHSLTLDLVETIEERDEVDRYAKRLEQELKALERKIPTTTLPLDPKMLESSLIIDYDALGDTPQARLTLLLDLYEAALAKQPHEGLEKTNWFGLSEGEFRGILMLGLETLLLDAVKLPLRRFLRMQSFSREALLHSLFHKIESPRLGA